MNDIQKAIELCEKIERDMKTLAKDLRDDIQNIRDIVDKLEAEIMSIKKV